MSKLDTYSELLDAHQKLHPERSLGSDKKRKPGRPRGQYAVKNYTVTLAQNDIDAINTLVAKLSDNFGKRVSRGAVIGWLVRWLLVELRKLEMQEKDQFSSFSELSKLIQERD